jgi:hypothetical protein
MPHDDDRPHTDLSDEEPSGRADPRIDLRDLIESTLRLPGGMMYQFKMRTSPATGGVVALAISIALVTAIAIGLMGMVLGFGAPVWAALVSGSVPVALFGAIYAVDRRRATRDSDAKSALGRRVRRGEGRSRR